MQPRINASYLSLLLASIACQSITDAQVVPPPFPESSQHSGPAAHSDEPRQECGTVVTPELAALILQDMADNPPPPDNFHPRYVFHIRVQFTIVRQNNGTGGMDPARIPACLAALNAAFSPWSIVFEELSPVTFLNSDAFFNIETEAEFTQMHTENFVADGVHMFFVNQLQAIGGNDLCGISTMPIQLASNGIALANDCAPPGNNTTIAHEMGHFFGLFHTHETIFGVECPSGFNCALSGDNICDTPADPNLGLNPTGDRVSSSCTIQNMPPPPFVCGPTPAYNPNPRNFMCYSPVKSCRDHFTYDQARAMWLRITNDTRGFFHTNPITAWIDFGYSGGGFDGAFDTPYPGLQYAIDHEPQLITTQRFVIKSSNTNETIRITRPMILDSFRGASTIGR